ncbi:hypothetical protein QMO56_19195 [Roseomonas sp. E05]|uniref:hypothetical protein n=1 Tax=Roseomonas sp. E05 TaxID=3046310 RepID=UPI0024B88267|nr:hypothetical protein [Roseomonas sp. E05]MDJ0390242.1 hypothetical protein [Roseomonas sp. E05]
MQLARQYARLRRHECRTDPERPEYRMLAALLPMPLPQGNLARKSGLCPAQTLACLRDLEKIGLAVQTTDGTWTHAVRTTFGRKAVEASRDA